MFKRSLLLSVVMFGLVNAASNSAAVIEDGVTEAAAGVAVATEKTVELVAEAGKEVSKEAASLLSQAYSAVKASASFAVDMINPREVYATVSDLANDLYTAGIKTAGTNLWANHKPTIALTAVVTTLAALEAYDNLVSKAFKKAKEALSN